MSLAGKNKGVSIRDSRVKNPVPTVFHSVRTSQAFFSPRAEERTLKDAYELELRGWEQGLGYNIKDMYRISIYAYLSWPRVL